MAFHIILENIGGELDRWSVNNENDLREKMLEVVNEIACINPGDVFRVVEDD